MSTKLILTKKQATIILWLVFLFSVLIRIPQLSHPLAHHHESITALELTAVESWHQADGPGSFYGIPPVNYQQPGDIQLPNKTNIDTKGNEVYISYGTVWNLLPYYFFSWLHIAPSLLALRLLNICIGFIGCLLLFKLMILIAADEKLKYTSAAVASIVFMLAPANLWYFSNVYVNCSFAIPLLLAFLYLLIKMLLQPSSIGYSYLTILLLLIIALFLTDWIACFMAASSAIAILFYIKKNRGLIKPLLIIIIGIITGATIFSWQVLSVLGGNAATKNLSEKFLFRSVHLSDGLYGILKAISIHFVSAFLPLIILLVSIMVLKYRRRNSIPTDIRSGLFYKIFLPALLLYNLVFLSWTSIHEFSILYYGLVFAVAIGNLLPVFLNRTIAGIAILTFIMLCCIQFYLINLPGTKGLNGIPYDSYKKIGLAIAEKTNNNQVIFSNAPLLPPVNYYAKRLITFANSPEEARQLLSHFKNNEAVWVEVKNLQVTSILYLRK